MTEPQTKRLADRTIALTHTFGVPAAKVFAAYTDAKQVAQWWGFPKGSLKVDRVDVRPGGGFRFTQSLPDGRTLVSTGSYLEVKPVTRLVYTFKMEGMPGEPVTTTIELAEDAGRTTLTLTIEFPSKEAKDMAAKFGASAGAKASLLSLAEFLGA
jgi:uncharacterized protein YndB with AHSA1/START domain